MSNTELLIIDIDEAKALEAFTTKDGLDPLIQQVRDLVESFEHDLSTAAGRKRTASLARRVSSFKVRLDELGKSLTDDWAKKKKAVDENRRRMRNALDELRDEARRPLTELEEKEKKERDALVARVQSIISLGEIDCDMTLDAAEGKLESLRSTAIDDTYGDMELDAYKAKESGIAALEAWISKERERIKQEAEIARLKAEAKERERLEREERIKIAAAEEARRAAEKKAKEEKERIIRERKEAEERERQAKLAAEAAIAAAEAAKIEAALAAERARKEEIERQRAEREKREEEQREREANSRHVRAVMKAAKEDLMAKCGLDEQAAKKVVLAVRNGSIANLRLDV